MSVIFEDIKGEIKPYVVALRKVLEQIEPPFTPGDRIGIKLHWGERRNEGFLPPDYAREIARWLLDQNLKPFVFDTTVLYSGGRRTAADSLQTAYEHGYTQDFLGCPIVIADGPDGHSVVTLTAGYKHFETVEVADIFEQTEGFVIFSHVKGHLASLFGGAIKNLSMGFASRAQKQRMHADYHPVLHRDICTRCGICAEVCPTHAASISNPDYPTYDLDRCIGCAQCVAMCPDLALEIFWGSDPLVFQEKLVETAAAVWKKIKDKSIAVNALINIVADCDCLPGPHPSVSPDLGFAGGKDPVELDAASLRIIGPERFERVHPDIPWRRQFSYAREIGFGRFDSVDTGGAPEK